MCDPRCTQENLPEEAGYFFWMYVKTMYYCLVRYVYPEWQENIFLLACTYEDAWWSKNAFVDGQ